MILEKAKLWGPEKIRGGPLSREGGVNRRAWGIARAEKLLGVTL